MEDKRNGYDFAPLWFTVALAVIAAAVLLFVALCSGRADAAEKEEAPNEFIGGYDHADSFLSPWKPRGKNFRKRLKRIEERYRDYCETYMPDMKTECLIRILIESDGHEGSRTIDTCMREAGATSIGYDQAVMLCEEYGVCGDPCWDPEFAVGAYAWLVYEARKDLLERKWWRDWLPALCETNRSECELIITWTMDVNDGKAQKALMKTGATKQKHPWWAMIKQFRKLTDAEVLKLFNPLAVTMRKFGIRAGFVIQKQKIRAERNGGKYKWGPLVQKPSAKPPAKNPLPDEQDWRKTCHLYKSAAWFKTHPTMSWKSKKKYLQKLKDGP